MGEKQDKNKPQASKRMTVEQFFRQRFYKRVVIIAAFLFFLLIAAWMDHANWFLYHGNLYDQLHNQRALVIEVIDGDTISVNMLDLKEPDGSPWIERIRLWGLDTPETEKRRGTVLIREADPWANEAWAMTRKLCEQKIVTIKMQSHRTRGKFGRLLAYVILPDGTELGEHLLAAGLAEVEQRWQHDRLERYDLLQLAAKKGKVGMWGGSATAHSSP